MLIKLVSESITRPNQGAVQWAKLLHQERFPLTLLSNMPLELSRHVTKSFPSLSTFEYLIYSCDYGSIKPELSIYRNCLELLKAAPQDILYLDDRTENLEAAARLGVNSVLFDTVEKTASRDEIRLMQQRSLQQVRVSVSLVFLIHGLIIATWASRIPAFQAHLHLSPAVLGRSLMMAAIGSVLAMPAAGWLINKFGSLSIVIASTLGFDLALPLIAESNTVLALSVALLFYGAMAGSMDVAMNTHALMLEKRYQRHIMSSFHALFSLGGMAGSALGGLVASRAVPAGIHFWASAMALAAMSILAFRWLPLPSAAEDAERVATGGTITWSVPLGALALLAFSIMLVEGAIADWSAIYLRTSVLTGPGLAALGYAVFSGAMAGGRLTGDYLTGKLGRGHLVCYGALLAAV